MSTITIARLTDPVVDRHGFSVASDYTEKFWLPTLGPTATWLLRHIAPHTEGGAEYEVDVDTLGRSVGLVDPKGEKLAATLRRLETFGHGRQRGATHWRVRAFLAPLTRRQVDHLPEQLRHEHDVFMGVGRERTVTCRICVGRQTWAPDAICDACRAKEAQPA